MPRGRKRRAVNYNMNDFTTDTKMSKKKFDDTFIRFLEMYGLEKYVEDPNRFKKEPDEPQTDFEFVFEWYPIFRALMMTTDKHPFYRKNRQIKNVTVGDIVSYYDKTLEEIRRMPDYARFQVQGHPAYDNAVKEREILQRFAQKMAEFITGLRIITGQERADIFITIYKQLDEWLFTSFKNNYLLNAARMSNFQVQEQIVRKMADEVSRGLDGESGSTELLDQEKWKERRLAVQEIDELLEAIFRDSLNEMGRTNEKEHDSAFRKYAERNGMIVHLDQDIDGTDDAVVRDLYNDFLAACLELPGGYEESLIDRERSMESTQYEDRTAERRAERFLFEQAALTNEEKKSQRSAAKNREIERLRELIRSCEDRIDELESEDDFLAQGSVIEESMLKDYVTFSKNLREDSELPIEAAESFLGQLVAANFLRR